MRKITDQYVNTRKLLPPVGPYRYAASLFVCIRNDNGSTMQASLGEYYGQTEAEAEAKAEKALEDPFWKEGK